MPKFRTRFDSSDSPYSPPSGGAMRTQQHFRDECDVNRIISRMVRGGELTTEALTVRQGAFYGDVSSLPQSYQELMQVINRQRDDFSRLPSRLRAHFGNDVSKMLDFLANPANADQARAMGLLPPVPVALDTTGTTDTVSPSSPSTPSKEE